jgi:hypothetical protein
MSGTFGFQECSFAALSLGDLNKEYNSETIDSE